MLSRKLKDVLLPPSIVVDIVLEQHDVCEGANDCDCQRAGEVVTHQPLGR